MCIEPSYCLSRVVIKGEVSGPGGAAPYLLSVNLGRAGLNLWRARASYKGERGRLDEVSFQIILKLDYCYV